jgi:uncharacterized protein YndB with AHSA1/START domain
MPAAAAPVAKRCAKPTTYGSISSEAVKKATGKSWDEWCRVLDKAGCRGMSHKQIVAVINDKFDVGMWWQQMVTVGYEQARGLRVKNQKCDGDYQVSVNKTINAGISDTYKAFTDTRARGRWLADAKVDITTQTPNKSFRMKWLSDDSRVGVLFWNKGSAKTQVSVHHEKLSDTKAVERTRQFWTERLDRLKSVLESE